jgi:hypothetical protein
MHMLMLMLMNYRTVLVLQPRLLNGMVDTASRTKWSSAVRVTVLQDKCRRPRQRTVVFYYQRSEFYGISQLSLDSGVQSSAFVVPAYQDVVMVATRWRRSMNIELMTPIHGSDQGLQPYRRYVPHLRPPKPSQDLEFDKSASASVCTCTCQTMPWPAFDWVFFFSVACPHQ